MACSLSHGIGGGQVVALELLARSGPKGSTISGSAMFPGARAILMSALMKRKLLLIASLIAALNGCNRRGESRRESIPTALVQNVVSTEQKRPLPQCPQAPYAMVRGNDPNVGHHKIFLKWNASSSASQYGPDGLGYCLYRTQAAGAAKNCPIKSSKCEQVNFEPIRGTRCVDNLVKDSTTYYYTVLAITSAKAESTTSEEAIAQVPGAGKQEPAPADEASYPACRTSATPTPAQR